MEATAERKINVPFSRETKNYYLYELNNGVYIVKIYVPKNEMERRAPEVVISFD